MPFCELCGGWSADLKYHNHLPAWHVRRDWEDADDDGSKIYADTAKEAAEKYADYVDCNGDYHIVGGNPATMIVMAADGSKQTFEVTGEAVPSYYARPVK